MRILSCCVIVLFLLQGCAKRAPQGLPPLVPCTIRLVDGEKSFQGIGVTFQRREGHAGWSISGTTRSDGRAEVQTIAASYIGKGLPAGTYQLTLEEPIELPPELINDNDPTIPAKQQKYFDEHRTIPSILCDPTNSPLELIVTEGMNETTIDVSLYR